MRRGDIYMVDLEPVRGSEASKVRPAVIVSNNAANDSVVRHNRGVVTVAPLTSNTSRVLTFQVFLRSDESRLPKDSKVQCEQLRSVAPDRLLQRVGAVPRQRMAEIDVALRRHLAL
ncbi:type II toxin-antitoxin system PemK/MazF family toxin [Streptomyces hirsutus]|uniref:type II toxin-antitoxin system PemK/MazF family toxin n=1 Tax=Streptomyces hirsutus TaxID=35620 RepID=UPI0006E1E1EF|nr:type II toxin-antitoxin system PemK/MazF family toxin [Streptomyces hirsutus]